MEEQPTIAEGDPEITATPPTPPAPKPPIRRFSFSKLNRNLTLTISILLKVGGVVIVVLLLSVIYRQMRFDGYSLQAVHVPDAFERDGYGGDAVAAGIEAQLKRIKNRVETYDQWDISDGIEVGDYSVAESGSELEVNLVGVGFSIRSIVNLLGSALGIERNKSVTAYIALEKGYVTLTTYIKGQTPQEQTIPMDSVGLGATVKRITLAAAESILKVSNPELLVTYLSIGNRTQENLDKIIATSKYALKENQDSPRRKYLFTALGWALLDKRKYAEGIEASKMAVALDPGFVTAHFGVATGLGRMKQRKAAREYFRRTINVVESKGLREDQISFYRDVYYRSMLTSYRNDMFYDSVMLIQAQYLAFLSGLGNAALSRGHNEIAFDYSERGLYDSALIHARKAVAFDSSVAITYSTLAEIYGYQNNKDLFYFYLAKSIDKGFAMLEGYENDPPYNRYKDEKRFRDIWPLPLPPQKQSSTRTGN